MKIKIKSLGLVFFLSVFAAHFFLSHYFLHTVWVFNVSGNSGTSDFEFPNAEGFFAGTAALLLKIPVFFLTVKHWLPHVAQGLNSLVASLLVFALATRVAPARPQAWPQVLVASGLLAAALIQMNRLDMVF